MEPFGFPDCDSSAPITLPTPSVFTLSTELALDCLEVFEILLNVLLGSLVFFDAPSVGEGAEARALDAMFRRSWIASLIESVWGGTYSVFPVDVGAGAAGGAPLLIAVLATLPLPSKGRNKRFLFFLFGEDSWPLGGELLEISCNGRATSGSCSGLGCMMAKCCLLPGFCPCAPPSTVPASFC
jgi:hypothetical protein